MLIGVDASRVTVSQRTGTEVYSLNVVRELVGLDHGHRYRLYWRQAPPDDLVWSERTVANRVIKMPRLWTHLGLAREVTANPPDVLFIPAHVVPAARRCPTVVTIHDVGYLWYPRSYSRSRWWSLHLSTWFSVRQAQAVIADSEATKSDLVRRYGVAPDKISVVYLACDPMFRPLGSGEAIDEVKRRYGIEGEYFLHLGTLQPRKNIVGLLEAFGRFAAGHKGIKLVLAGRKGWLYEPVFRRVQELGLADDVVFVDYVPDEDLPGLIGGALALVFPSFYEGFGLPALQAMACGTPVVASSVSSLPEVVGEAGVLIDPHDTEDIAEALGRVAEDAALRAELSERGVRRAAEFSWRKCAAETLGVLERTKRPRPGSR